MSLTHRCLRCAFVVFCTTLLLVSTQNGKSQPTPPAYVGVVQSVRDAKKKSETDQDALYALYSYFQGEAYSKALQEAAECRDDTALRELYEAKHGIHWPRTVEGTPLLCYAAMNGDVEVVRLLLTRGAEVDAPNGAGWTPLHYAAERGDTLLVKMLLDKGAYAGSQTNRFGETPLMLACGLFGGGGRSDACARLLLAKGAEVNARTADYETALMFAAYEGLPAVVELLLAKKADATRKDFKGQTALSRVTEFERIDAHGEIVYTQDSPTVPTYKMKVFEALIRHGKVHYGRYVNEEAERQVTKAALDDFARIARLLREAEAQKRQKLKRKVVPSRQNRPR